MYTYLFFDKKTTELEPIHGHHNFGFDGYDINVVCPNCGNIIDAWETIEGTDDDCIMQCYNSYIGGKSCGSWFALCAGSYNEMFDINNNKCIENVTDDNTLAELENTIRIKNSHNNYNDIDIREYIVRKAELTYFTKIVIDEAYKYDEELLKDGIKDDIDLIITKDHIDSDKYIKNYIKNNRTTRKYQDCKLELGDIPEDKYDEYIPLYICNISNTYNASNASDASDTSDASKVYLTDDIVYLCDGNHIAYVSCCDKCKKTYKKYIGCK